MLKPVGPIALKMIANAATANVSFIKSIISHRQLLGLKVLTADTGDYCRARSKLKEDALRELAGTVGRNCEEEADETWLTKKRHVKLIDGLTFTMPETFASIPKTFTLRELKLSISQPGFRIKSIIVITTLTDVDEFSKEDVAELYGYRWNIELDIRSLKCNLNLDHVRCKSPEMVRCELWTTVLAYNLIRSTAAAAAALLHAINPRQISFTSTVQFGTLQTNLATGTMDNDSPSVIQNLEV